jgi:hypothetical protein
VPARPGSYQQEKKRQRERGNTGGTLWTLGQDLPCWMSLSLGLDASIWDTELNLRAKSGSRLQQLCQLRAVGDTTMPPKSRSWTRAGQS